jgi:hypothetical protein
VKIVGIPTQQRVDTDAVVTVTLTKTTSKTHTLQGSHAAIEGLDYRENAVTITQLVRPRIVHVLKD